MRQNVLGDRLKRPDCERGQFPRPGESRSGGRQGKGSKGLAAINFKHLRLSPRCAIGGIAIEGGQQQIMGEAWNSIAGDEATGILLIADHASRHVPGDIDLGIGAFVGWFSCSRADR